MRQQLTDEFAVALAYGRSQFNDKQRGSDLDHVDTVHASLFWPPIERLTFDGPIGLSLAVVLGLLHCPELIRSPELTWCTV